jgi:hypothetical protein
VILDWDNGRKKRQPALRLNNLCILVLTELAKYHRRTKSEYANLFVMARRPHVQPREEILNREHLDELARSLAHLSMSAVLDFYQRAYRDCRIINSSTFPPARAVQELVQAWKQLRKWRRK